MINEELRKYIEENIFPQYEKHDSGHTLEHIDYVIRRSLKFAETVDDINNDMVYVVAAFHDIGHIVDPKNHEKISAEIFGNDQYLKRYFNKEEVSLIKEAIEDHRASLEGEPRSIYGKIVSSADRSTSLDSTLSRTFSYRLKRSPNLTIDQIIEESKEHVKNKFGGKNSYASKKMYFKDEEFEKMLSESEELTSNSAEFKKRYLEVNNVGDSAEYIQSVFKELSRNEDLSSEELFAYTYNKLITDKSFEEVKGILEEQQMIAEMEKSDSYKDSELENKLENKPNNKLKNNLEDFEIEM